MYIACMICIKLTGKRLCSFILIISERTERMSMMFGFGYHQFDWYESDLLVTSSRWALIFTVVLQRRECKATIKAILCLLCKLKILTFTDNCLKSALPLNEQENGESRSILPTCFLTFSSLEDDRFYCH
jgi:hypothetical protein